MSDVAERLRWALIRLKFVADSNKRGSLSHSDARAIIAVFDALTAKLAEAVRERDAAKAALMREIQVQRHCRECVCADTSGDNCLCGIAYRTAIEGEMGDVAADR